MFLLESVGENLLSSIFQFQKQPTFLVWRPSSIFKACRVVVYRLSDLLPTSYKDSCDYIWSTQ